MFLYKSKGDQKRVSINLFCMSYNVTYTVFYESYKNPQRKVVSVECNSIPVSSDEEEFCQHRI